MSRSKEPSAANPRDAIPRRGGTGSSTVQAIKSHILDRGLRPGDPLPTEAELVQELGVSRSSVREAIRTLVSLDLVEVRHGHGTTVGNMSLAPFITGLVFRSLLNPDGHLTTLREVVQLREGIDSMVALQLVERLRGEEMPELEALVERMRERSAAGESFMEEDQEFHRLLLNHVGNDLATELVVALWEVNTIVVPLLGIAAPDDIRDTVEAHGDMLKALRAGDADAYRQAVVAHYRPLHKILD